jgi:hypothetical protein
MPTLRNCEEMVMHKLLITLAALMLVACGGKPSADAAGSASPVISATLAGASSDPSSESSVPASSGQELQNPDNTSVVFLYYKLAGLTPPIDNWAEEDGRVRYAAAIDKAPRREVLRAELHAAAKAVKDIGALRLTMNADLSDYDPGYSEFTVRALAPSSVVTFDAFGQKVKVSFANGRTAQLWHLDPAAAQNVRDRIGNVSTVDIDVLLRIVKVLPGAGGGTIVTEVVEYEMRDRQRGITIGRVQIKEQKVPT